MIRQLALAGLALTALSLGACGTLDPNVGVPHAYAYRGEITPMKVDYQDKVVLPHCSAVVKHTTPSTLQELGVGFINGATTGGLAAGAGYKATAWSYGATVASKAVVATAVGGLVSGGIQGAANTALTGHYVKRGNVDNCLVLATGGYQLADPKTEVKYVRKTGQAYHLKTLSEFIAERDGEGTSQQQQEDAGQPAPPHPAPLPPPPPL